MLTYVKLVTQYQSHYTFFHFIPSLCKKKKKSSEMQISGLIEILWFNFSSIQIQCFA